MSIKHVLDNEIREELENLGKESIGSEEYKANVDGVTKLLDRKIELEKLEIESKERIESRNAEIELKLQQMSEEKKDRFVRNSITIGTFVGSCVMYSLAFVASTNFEREGTLTTEGGRNSIKNLFNLLKIR